MSKQYLIFFGPPGSGKGTQAKRIGERYGLPVISTGDLLRREVELKTAIGKKVENLLSQGKYAPEELVSDLLSKRLQKADARSGAIFDGYPRTESQQGFLNKKLKKHSLLAVLVDVGDAGVKKRLGGRRACACGHVYHTIFNPPKKAGRCDFCGGKLYIRNDDKPAVIKERLKTYHQQTEPLLSYWRGIGKLVEVDGEQKIEKVFKDMIKKLGKNIKK